jgi:hypothetical protein
MSRSFLNYDLMRSFALAQFQNQTPFPWFNFHEFLTPEGFRELYQDFPSLTMFEQHHGIERVHGQRPHDRYYLAYEKSLYGAEKGPGVVDKEDLPQSWQYFVEEIETSKQYHDFIRGAFGVSTFGIRFAWHVGTAGSEVSPHCDGESKHGTHIFYFNTSEDWNEEWGGSTLVLGDKQTPNLNPDFSDFASATSSILINNHSFLFKNTEAAWHGVKPLTCPEGSYRRLFNVIFVADSYAHHAVKFYGQEQGLTGKAKSLMRRLVRN